MEEAKIEGCLQCNQEAKEIAKQVIYECHGQTITEILNHARGRERGNLKRMLDEVIGDSALVGLCCFEIRGGVPTASQNKVTSAARKSFTRRMVQAEKTSSNVAVDPKRVELARQIIARKVTELRNSRSGRK